MNHALGKTNYPKKLASQALVILEVIIGKGRAG